MLQPGGEIIANQGGLHKFMNWQRPMLTDSGGFQIFSLGYGSITNEIKRKKNLLDRNKSLLEVNEGGAKSSEIEELINKVKKKVFEKTGIDLELEIKIIGQK